MKNIKIFTIITLFVIAVVFVTTKVNAAPISANQGYVIYQQRVMPPQYYGQQPRPIVQALPIVIEVLRPLINQNQFNYRGYNQYQYRQPYNHYGPSHNHYGPQYGQPRYRTGIPYYR